MASGGKPASGAAPADGDAPATGAIPLANLSLEDALGLTGDQAFQFKKWLDFIAKRYRDLKWEKILPLAPLLEINSTGKTVNRLRLHFQKLQDSDGNLTGILAFGLESSVNPSLNRELEAERIRHRLEIRDILALSSNPTENLSSFFNDIRERLEKAKSEWDLFMSKQKAQFNPALGPWQSSSEESLGQKLFRELHMVKGNAGAFGFEGLAAIAQEAENYLESLKHWTPSSARIMHRLSASLTELQTQLEEIRRSLKLIAGEGQDAMARILKWKLDRLVNAAKEVNTEGLEPILRTMVESTRSLPYLSPAYLARKYRNLVERISMNLGKRIVFRVTSNTGDIHPESYSRVDEALVHILRNMVDHGIESPAEREALGKDEAEIGMEYVMAEDRIFIRIRDNGRGMNPTLIAERSIRLGLVTAEEAGLLDDTGKLGLIFREGFTTRDQASMVSGRGLGLALAARCVQDQGGNIYVYAKMSEGTRFALELPHLGQNSLPA